MIPPTDRTRPCHRGAGPQLRWRSLKGIGSWRLMRIAAARIRSTRRRKVPWRSWTPAPALRRGPRCRSRSGRTRWPRCTCGPRSSARSGWLRRRGSITRGTSRSTSRRAASRPRRFPTARARSRSPSTSSITSSGSQTSDGAVAPSRSRRARWPTSTQDVMAASQSLGIDVQHPDDAVRDPRPRSRSTRTDVHAPTTRRRRTRFWRVLVQADRVLKAFRARFIGKCSPVHFFWGSFDLAVTRFSGRPRAAASGRRAQLARLGDARGVLARGEQLRASGPAAGRSPEAAFYAYAYPEPDGFKAAAVRPEAARTAPSWASSSCPMRRSRRAAAPDAALLDFLQSTYEAAADRAGWDRAGLERGSEPTAGSIPGGS